MQPRLMLATSGEPKPQGAVHRQLEFIPARSDARRDVGEDPRLRSALAMLRHRVQASDGEIGHVEGMIFDDDTWTVRCLIVNTSDWWLGHEVLIAPAWIEDISWLEATVSVGLSRDAVKHASAFDPDALPDRHQEVRMHEHDARPGYWGEPTARASESRVTSPTGSFP